MVSGPSGRNQKIINSGGCESSRLKNRGTRYLAFTTNVCGAQSIISLLTFGESEKPENKGFLTSFVAYVFYTVDSPEPSTASLYLQFRI